MENLYNIAKDLITWYQKNARILPWRENISPYGVWISEIMLQQTRVEAVKKYYIRFMEELPTIKELSEKASISQASARRLVANLSKKGVIEQSGDGKARYFIQKES